MIKDWKRYFFVKDHRVSILKVVDVETGAVHQELKYSEFGDVLQDTNPGFQPFGFAGGLYDWETKLVRFGARDYDGKIGRWLSKDPIRFDGGTPNLYEYAMNDPVNFIDTNGNLAIPLILPLIPILTNAAIATAKVTVAAIAAYALSKSLPLKGPPNGSEVLPDNNGGKKQERFYDGNGNPIKDIDWGHDHGAGKPHIHDWIPRPGQPPKRGPGRPPGQGECS